MQAYGDTKDEIVDENSPTNPLPFIAPRLVVEKQITDAGGIIVRPGDYYLRINSQALCMEEALPSLLDGLQHLQREKLLSQVISQNFPSKIQGTGNQVFSFVHVADLAELYHLVVLRGNELRGQLFNATHTLHVFKDALQAIAKAVGFTGELKFVPAQDPLSEAISVNSAVSSNKVVGLRINLRF